LHLALESRPVLSGRICNGHLDSSAIKFGVRRRRLCRSGERNGQRGAFNHALHCVPYRLGHAVLLTSAAATAKLFVNAKPVRRFGIDSGAAGSL
jgi:hypothetical protein